MNDIIQEALTKGVEQHVAGKFEIAAQLYRSVLRIQPNHADANHNMGLLKLDTGLALEALPYLQTALQADTSISQFWISYIGALITLKKFDEAIRILNLAKENGLEGDEFIKFERKLSYSMDQKSTSEIELVTSSKSKPNILDTLNFDKAFKLAKTKNKNGKRTEARSIYQDILEKFPKNKRALRELTALSRTQSINTLSSPPHEAVNQLNNLYNQGQAEKVIDKAQEILKQYPQAFKIWNILGAAAIKAHQIDYAIKAFQKVVDIKPDSYEAYNNLGIAFIAQGHHNAAEKAFKKAISLKKDYPEAIKNMGSALKELGEHEKSIDYYKRALAIKPNYSEAWNDLGNVFKLQNKKEEAKKAYRKAITINPDNAGAHRNLSIIEKYTAHNPQLVTVSNMLKMSCIDDSKLCHLNYAYAKMMEDIGNIEEAFKHYVKGAALRKKILAYDFKNDKIMFQKIKDTALRFKPFLLDYLEKKSQIIPIFIVGMPRSGTTLTEQIISSHSQVQGAGELYLMKNSGFNLSTGQQEVTTQSFLDVRKYYLDEIKKISQDKVFVTDKMPMNFFHIGVILKAIPEAKIIHVKRDPAATCWSNFKHYFSARGLGYSYDLDDIVQFYRLYQDLMEFWDKEFNNKIYHLDYDRLVVEQKFETKKLIEHLELDWEASCLFPEKNNRIVKTASQMQIQKKIYKDSSQSWLKFRPYLNNKFSELFSIDA